MGNNGLWDVLAVATPERQTDEIVVLRGRNCRKPIEAVTNPIKISDAKMVNEVRVAIARLRSLFCGKISSLRRCKGV